MNLYDKYGCKKSGTLVNVLKYNCSSVANVVVLYWGGCVPVYAKTTEYKENLRFLLSAFFQVAKRQN